MDYDDERAAHLNTLVCDLCTKTFMALGQGNNGLPLTDKPVCDHCNTEMVIPARRRAHVKGWH